MGSEIATTMPGARPWPPRGRDRPSLTTCLFDNGLSVSDYVNYPFAERAYCLGAPGRQDRSASLVVGILGSQAFRSPQFLQCDSAKGADTAGSRKVSLCDVVAPEGHAAFLRKCYRRKPCLCTLNR